jgi:hypothetical protein
MTETWKQDLTTANECSGCGCELSPASSRILSVYDHAPICMSCKKKEEERSDYAEKSRQMIGQCMLDSELTYGGEPEGYCYHHFYPYKG